MNIALGKTLNPRIRFTKLGISGVQKVAKIRRLQHYLILAVIVIGSTVSIVALKFLWAEWLLVNAPLHATLEAVGGLAAIAVALLLILKKHEQYGGNFFLLAMGFLGMGLLDVFHAVSLPSHGFILLHSVANFVGALWFALTWLPWCVSEKNTAWKKWTPWGVVIGAIFFGVWTLAIRETLPIMAKAGIFTTTAVTFNLLSAMFFMVAATRLLIDFGRIGRPEIFLFACMATLFGLANLTFPVSGLWDATWWFWHLLRLTSYLLALGFVIHEHHQTISDLRVALVERKKTEGWLQTLIATTQDAVISIDHLGRIVLFNPAAEQIFGYTEAEAQGQKINLLMGEPYASEHDDYIARFERTREPRAIGHIRTVVGRRKNGEEFPLEVSITQITNDEEIRYAAFIRDISEKKRLHDQLIENERLAAIGATAAALAHEIGNPLNGMSMTAQVLERRLTGALDTTIISGVRTLRNEIGRLSDLLHDFGSFSRRERYNFQSTSVAEVAEEVCAMEIQNYENRGIRLQKSFPEGLALVKADRNRLKQALLNMCKNAVEAMPNGGMLTLRARNSGENIVLEIADTGAGIPAGVNIFASFTTTKSHGTGLGLMIVRQIVLAHQGTISYRTEVDKGTLFTVTLPAAEPTHGFSRSECHSH